MNTTTLKQSLSRAKSRGSTKFIFLSLVGLLAGCSQQETKLEKNFKRIDHINKYDADFMQEKHNIITALKKFTPDECIEYFGVNIVKCGYRPLQITISNFSNEIIFLSPINISLKLVSPKKVAKSCHWKTGEIITGAGLFSWFLFPPGLIPTAYCGTKMQEENEKISKSIIKQDVIHCWDNVSILPSEIVSRIIFVSTEDLKNRFLISLFSQKDKHIEFNVKLAE